MKKIIALSVPMILAATTAFAVDTSNQTQPANQNQMQMQNSNQSQNQTQHVKPVAVSNVLQRFQTAGYVVTDVMYNKDDNTYKVTAYNPQGQKQDVTVDGKQGMVPTSKEKPLTMAQAAKKVEKSGYMIDSISSSDTYYKVTATDKQNNSVNLRVDMQKGDVTKD